MEIAIDRIIVPEGRRPLDPAKVVEIAGSITLLGLLAPIGLRSCVDGRIELVWGGHRLAACQSLGMESIYAIQVDTRVQGSAADLDDYVKMTEFAENLHRNELTTSQRDEFLAAWVALVEKRGPQLGGDRQVKKPGPKPCTPWLRSPEHQASV
jgi:ParB-like chromosome segregation protein Spo0J